MKTSKNGIKFLKNEEGCKLYAYDDMTGVPVKAGGICRGTLTIGVGHTGKDVYPGQTITDAQAEEILAKDIISRENIINSLVKVPLTQNQFDALVSFVYNIGESAFKNSTMLKLINSKNFKAAAEQFALWHRGNGVPHLLDNRRKREKTLFVP